MFIRLRRFIRGLQASEKYDLAYLFKQAHPTAPLSDKISWVASLIEWVRTDGGATPGTRVRFILQWLERHPSEKERSASVIRSVLRETTHIRLYTDVGIPTEPTFGREFRHRLLNVFIPEYRDPSDLAGVQARVFYDDNDPRWLHALPPEVIVEVLAWIRTGLPAEEHLTGFWAAEVLEAARILSARALAVTLREDLLRRSPRLRLRQHPLARLCSHLEALEIGETPDIFEAMRADLADARRWMTDVRSVLEQTGISVDIVYQMDRVRSDLVRLNRLIGLLERRGRPEELRPYFLTFWQELVRGHQLDSDFGAIFRKHIGLLSKKITERTGVTGEHYITQTRAQYTSMLGLAAGGGILTAFTAYIKAIGPHHSPLFVEFMFNATNYAGSFLLMHFLGFKLATKQPSMTAAALASKLKEEGGQADDNAFSMRSHVSRVRSSRPSSAT